MNFDNLDYLKQGTPTQRRAFKVLTASRIFAILEEFTPILTGTVPINVNIQTSDLDITCCWHDKQRFVDRLRQNFLTYPGFSVAEILIRERPTILAHFKLEEFEIEIFGQNRPSKEQESFRHMVVEHALLQKYGEDFRQQVIQLKKNGMKTEPAFAKVLGIVGDPYTELLGLSSP